MAKTLNAVLMLLCLLALSACADDEEGGRSRYVIDLNGVQASDAVSDLSDAELGEVCGSYDAYVQAEISFEAISYVACLPASIFLGGGNPQECRRLLDNCMGAFPDPIQINAQAADESVCIESLRSCNAVVADLEGCVNLNLGLVFDILDNWTCGDTDDARIKEAARAMDTVSLCANVDASCGLGNLPRGPM